MKVSLVLMCDRSRVWSHACATFFRESPSGPWPDRRSGWTL